MGYDSSEDEYELVPKSVDNFWLEDGDENPISFADLPYSKTGEDVKAQQVVFLRGTQDNGMRLFVKALAWRLELGKDIKPVFHVKTDKYWIQLLKPRKSYEEMIRSVMVVAQFVNYAWVHPEDPERLVWNYVTDAFPSWEIQPSRNELSSHLSLMQQLITTEEGLDGSSAVQSVVSGSAKKKLASTTEDGRQGSRKRIYVSDDEPEPSGDQKRFKSEAEELQFGEEMDGYVEDVDAGDLSETVCSICDNGGDVICCDGPCMRSFHLNKNADGASEANCSSLGFSKADVERMDKFFCPNCKYKQHQCYICGELGCSDEAAGAGQEVFMCDAAICGHFYHPQCVASMIARDKDSSEVDRVTESIREGKGFVCPMHKCWKCGKGEVKDDEDLHFGICRRCPRVWHRKCFPPSLLFEATDDEEQRAWEDLLPNRILIYCKRHKINPKLGTPVRDHVNFPPGSLPPVKKPAEARKSKLSKSDSQTKKQEQDSRPTKSTPDSKDIRKLDSSGLKKKLDSSMSQVKPDIPRPLKNKSELDKSVSRSMKKSDECVSFPTLSKSRPELDGSAKQERSSGPEQRQVKLAVSRDSTMQELQKSSKPSPFSARKTNLIETEVRNMIDALVEKSRNSVTIESVQKKLDTPLCYRRNPNAKNPDKKYSSVKIESIIRGMRKAVETLDSGGSIEDAQAKCSPDFIKHLEACKNELKVYLAPFLHGSRYTSYGRHFTKTEKLEEIVDRLQWYIKEGDMVVDFCCGANEFSVLMKKKLDEVGKKCDFKNFDCIQTKTDFNFFKRDWFQVKQDELVDGNRLIMGLNPPFGVKGQLANSFIDHALKFKPKLIILIVPKETERLDRKHDSYDLIWEDLDLLKGQAFYLPGSVDLNENPLSDWNAVAPPLFLWSRPDWTPKHRQIAQDQGHVSQIVTSGPPRYAGKPRIPQPRPVSPLLMVDTSTDKPRNRREIASKQDICKDESLDNSVHSDRVGTTMLSDNPEEGRVNSVAEENGSQRNQASRMILGSRGREMENSKSSERHGYRAGKVEISRRDQWKRESPETIKYDADSNHEVSKQVRKSNERYNRNMATRVDIAKFDEQTWKSPEKYRRNVEAEPGGGKSPGSYDRHGLVEAPDKSRTHGKGMNSPERYKQVIESRNDSVGYSEQRRHSPERYSRHGLRLNERVAEKSRLSPEIHGYVPEFKSDSVRQSERRELSSDKFERSSEVDLEKHHFSKRDGNNDSFSDYDTLLKRVNTDKDYPDSIHHRHGSPERDWRYEPENSKRSWIRYDKYGNKRVSDDFERETGYQNKDYVDAGVQKRGSLYEDNMAYEAQEGVYRKTDYLDQETYGVRRQDMLGFGFQSIDGLRRKRDYDDAVIQATNGLDAAFVAKSYSTEMFRGQDYNGLDLKAAGHFGEATIDRTGRNADFYSSNASGGLYGLQGLKYGRDAQMEPAVNPFSKYGMQGTPDLRPNSSYHSSSGDGILSLPEHSLTHPQFHGRGWLESALSTNPTSLYQQPALRLGESSLHPSHNLFDNHHSRHPSNLSQYPLQGRFTGPGRSQFSGGWIDE